MENQRFSISIARILCSLGSSSKAIRQFRNLETFQMITVTHFTPNSTAHYYYRNKMHFHDVAFQCFMFSAVLLILAMQSQRQLLRIICWIFAIRHAPLRTHAAVSSVGHRHNGHLPYRVHSWSAHESLTQRFYI